MKIVLDIATILGGIAAIWFFWDRFSNFEKRKNERDGARTQLNSSRSLTSKSPLPTSTILKATLYGTGGLLIGVTFGFVIALFIAVCSQAFFKNIGWNISEHVYGPAIGGLMGMFAPVMADEEIDSLDSFSVKKAATISGIAGFMIGMMCNLVFQEYILRHLAGGTLVFGIVGAVWVFQYNIESSRDA